MAKDEIFKFNSRHSKRGSEKSMQSKPKDLPLAVPRATGIPQLQRNNVVQVGLGTSRSALDALLPVIVLPNSSTCETKQSSNAHILAVTTPDSQLQVVSPTSLPSLLPICAPFVSSDLKESYMESVRTNTHQHTKELKSVSQE